MKNGERNKRKGFISVYVPYYDYFQSNVVMQNNPLYMLVLEFMKVPFQLINLEIETSDGKRSFIMNLRIIVTTHHMIDKLEKDSHL